MRLGFGEAGDKCGRAGGDRGARGPFADDGACVAGVATTTTTLCAARAPRDGE